VLAFVTYDGAAALVVQSADGDPRGTVPLVDDATTSVSWALSPDGTRVAWFKPVPSGDTETTELWVAPTAGGPGVRILPPSADPNETYESPLWSPDGGHIAFDGSVTDPSTSERHRSGIYVVGVDGTGVHRLTTRWASHVEGMSWSPDGHVLAYVGAPDGVPIPTAAADDGSTAYPADDVFVIAVDGTGDRNLTVSPGFESDPAWSPDGAFLAFATTAVGSNHRLTTIRLDGPSPVGAAVPGPETDWFVWSPDATRLLWLESTQLDPETDRTTFHSIDPNFRGPSTTLQVLDGRVVCAPSWRRLEP
jgi:Tol biopolymer transport system component